MLRAQGEGHFPPDLVQKVKRPLCRIFSYRVVRLFLRKNAARRVALQCRDRANRGRGIARATGSRDRDEAEIMTSIILKFQVCFDKNHFFSVWHVFHNFLRHFFGAFPAILNHFQMGDIAAIKKSMNTGGRCHVQSGTRQPLDSLHVSLQCRLSPVQSVSEIPESAQSEHEMHLSWRRDPEKVVLRPRPISSITTQAPRVRK